MDRPDGKKANSAKLEQDAEFHLVEQTPTPGRYRVAVNWVLDNAWSNTEQAAEIELRLHRGDDQPQSLASAKLGFVHPAKGVLAGEIAIGDQAGSETKSSNQSLHLSVRLKVLNDDATSALPEQTKPVRYSFCLEYADVIGPLDGDQLAYRNGEKILFNGPPPQKADEAKLDQMSREVIELLAFRAFRRTPPDRCRRSFDRHRSANSQRGGQTVRTRDRDGVETHFGVAKVFVPNRTTDEPAAIS